MNANERRLRKLEHAMPKTVHSFTATLRENDPALALDDSRLRRGVEEFVFTFAEGTINPGGKERRGLGYVNPWTVAEFWGGGKRAVWNKALALLRADPDFDDSKTGRVMHGAIDFAEEDGEVRRLGGLTFIGWSRGWWEKYRSAVESNPLGTEEQRDAWGAALLGKQAPASFIIGDEGNEPEPEPTPRIAFRNWQQPANGDESKRRRRLQNLGIDLDD